MDNENKQYDKPIRVLEVCQRMEAAGVQSFLMNIYRNIDREKVQLDFLVHYDEHNFYDDEIEALGGKIYRFPVRENYNIIKYVRDLCAFFRGHKEYRIIHGHMDSLGMIYLKCAQREGIKVRIAHSHNSSVQDGIKKYFRLFMIKRYKEYANHLFACSNDAGKFMFGDSDFEVIHNVIDSEKYKYDITMRNRKRKEIGCSDSFVIGNVGRLHVQKNQLFLVDVFYQILKQIPNSKLLLIGSGELEKELKKKIQEYGISEQVTILNNRKDVNELYQAMDVYVMPSLYEGLPVSAIEAQASGLLCVFSDSITKETDITGNVKYISLDQSVEYWAEHIISSFSKHERKDMKEAIIKRGYDAKTVALNIQDMYLQMHNNNPRGK